MRTHHKAATGGADDADGSAAAVQNVASGRLIEVSDYYDGGAGPFGELFEGFEGRAHVFVGVGVDVLPEERHDRVDDHELGVHPLDGPLQLGEVLREPERVIVAEYDHLTRIPTGGVETGPDRVPNAVFG